MQTQSVVPKKATKSLGVLALVVLSILVSLPVITSGGEKLETMELMQWAGGDSIWDDPCTGDGALVGAGIVLKSPFMVAMGLIKAVYEHNCF